MAIVVRDGGEPFEGAGDADLGQRVDRRGRLVEDQHVRAGETGTQQGDELPFARRQLIATLADARGQAFGQRLDPVADAELVDDAFDVGPCRVFDRERDVGAHRIVEEERLLRHHDRAAVAARPDRPV